MKYWPGRSWKKEILELGKIIAVIIIGIGGLLVLIYVFGDDLKPLLAGFFIGILLTLFVGDWRRNNRMIRRAQRKAELSDKKSK